MTRNLAKDFRSTRLLAWRRQKLSWCKSGNMVAQSMGIRDCFGLNHRGSQERAVRLAAEIFAGLMLGIGLASLRIALVPQIGGITTEAALKAIMTLVMILIVLVIVLGCGALACRRKWPTEAQPDISATRRRAGHLIGAPDYRNADGYAHWRGEPLGAVTNFAAGRVRYPLPRPPCVAAELDYRLEG